MPDLPTAKKQTWRFSSLKNLRAAPRSFLRHPDPFVIGTFTAGEQLMSGRFALVGHIVDAPDLAIWSIAPPSKAFFGALHSFEWLADLAAIGNSAARKQAQQWVLGWIETFGSASGPAWEPGLAGLRLVHVCAHAMFVFKGLSPKPSARVFKSLGRHVNFVAINWKSMPDGLAKLQALTGMIYAGLCLEGCEYALRPALDGVRDICAGWIGADGSLPSRSPEGLAQAFILLSWAERLLVESGHPKNPDIANALERIAPGVRALRFGDGSLARFHGGGGGAEDQLDQALADARLGVTTPHVSFMGYQRLSAGRITAIMDAARPPDEYESVFAFEMAYGRFPVLCNCGPGGQQGGAWAEACQRASAHNTLTIEGQGPAPEDIHVERAHDLESVWLSARHEGFEPQFGLTHERRLLVATNGRQLSGEDRLYPRLPPADVQHPSEVLAHPARGHSFMLHFHLHPDIEAEMSAHDICLALPDGTRWTFKQEGGLESLMASVFLDPGKLPPRATKQIVVTGRTVDYVGAIRWSFIKT